MPFVVVQYLNNFQLFCNPMDCSLLGISDHAISQVRIQECVAISFSRVSSRPRDQTMSPAQAGRFFTSEAPGKPLEMSYIHGKRICMYVCLYIYICVCPYVYVDIGKDNLYSTVKKQYSQQWTFTSWKTTCRWLTCCIV